MHESPLLSLADLVFTVKEAAPANLWTVEGSVDPL